MKQPSRTPTTAAIGFLVLDALLLVYGGVELRRPWLIVAGGACALAAILVLAAWRRYRHTLAELDTARRQMKRDVESIRALLHTHRLDN